jgi:hypothetical protein
MFVQCHPLKDFIDPFFVDEARRIMFLKFFFTQGTSSDVEPCYV